MTILQEIQNCVKNTFGLVTLKPYQLLVAHRIIEQFETEEEENQIVILPTGSGKSLCFLVPAVLCPGITIIVYPLLVLMNDQSDKLREKGIDAVNLRGGQTPQERNAVFNKLRHGTKIVITNPETLNQPTVIKRLKEFKIEMFVVDEAHVISQWGKSFRPSYLNLKNTIEELRPHQIMAFTATATKQTVDDIKSCLFSREPIVVQSDTDRDNIYYSAYPVYSKTEGLVELLKKSELPAIVFCSSRYRTYELCVILKRFFPHYQMRYYHAGLTKMEREAIETWFKNTDEAVLFTTCAYGLGVDIPGIRTIIHYDLPDDALEYLQESGRAGRDRNEAKAWVLTEYGKPAGSELESIFKGDTCRRRALLNCLGEQKEECTGCDICTNQVIKHPYGHSAVRLLIALHPFKYTKNTAAKLLCGDIFLYKYKHNPFYGLLDMDPLLLEESIDKMHLKTVKNKLYLPLRKFSGK